MNDICLVHKTAMPCAPCEVAARIRAARPDGVPCSCDECTGRRLSLELVERLRGTGGPFFKLMREGADRIERLEQALREIETGDSIFSPAAIAHSAINHKP